MGATKPTLCWKCQNANCGCSWSRFYEPVNGWEAISTIIQCHSNVGKKRNVETKTNSYLVLKCPEFKRDEVRKGENISCL